MKPAVQRPETLVVDRDDRGVVRLTLNRPEIRNAFDGTLINDLTATLDGLATDEGIRALVLTGAGATFSAGAELTWMRSSAEQGDHENFQDALRLAELMKRLDDMPMPTIARVNGAAMGGGVGLTACCDIAIAAETAMFGLTEVRLGIIPGAISPYVLRAIGPHEARRYFLTGERFDAATARRIGLIHEVAPADGLDAVVDGLLDGLLAAGPQAVRAAKDLIAHVALKEIDDLLIRDTAQRIARQRAGAEAREGLGAFLEKRKPGWIA